MTGVHKITSQVIDYAERVADMADAAQGKHRQRGGLTRWLLLPASGAAAYAMLRSDRFSRQAKGVLDDAKTRASELPEELVTLVRETVDGSSQAGGQGRRQASQARSSQARKRSSSSNSRSKSSPRKTTARKTT